MRFWIRTTRESSVFSTGVPNDRATDREPSLLCCINRLRWVFFFFAFDRCRSGQRLGKRQRKRRERMGEKIDGARTALGGLQGVHTHAGGRPRRQEVTLTT